MTQLRQWADSFSFLLYELVLSYYFTCEFRILHPNFAIFSFRPPEADATKK